MTTPSNFSLSPVKPAERPAPYPPRYLKRHMYTDPSVFGPIDSHAINEARTNYRSFRDLMWNLVYRMNFNELERARAIFRWLTTKNLYTIFFDSQMPGSPEQLVVGFKDEKTSYAKIFECLSTYAGLHCVTLSGWAKGVDCKPGSNITSTPSNHTWNAVYIDGGWQLVDCHWATRYVQADRKKRDNIIYEYDDFYFLSEPSMFIYSHCPQDASWQLLNPARSKADFEIYPTVKSYFFMIGMQFLQQNRGVLYTKRGIVTITLGFTEPTAFTYKLGYGESFVETLQGYALKRYVIQETTENRVTFYVRAPREGTYYITIFAQQLTEGYKQDTIFKAACEYKIICDRTSAADITPGVNPPEEVRPFPRCADINWGAGQPVADYGLVAAHRTALLAAPNGRAEVCFARTRPVILHAKLVRDGMSDSALEKCVTVGEQENQVYVTLRLPMIGEYGLEVYASEPARHGETFTHICQYLIAYTDRDFGAVYGQVYDRSDLIFNGMQPDAGPIYTNPTSRHGTLNYGSLRRPPQQLGAAPPSVSSVKPVRDSSGGRPKGQENAGQLVRANTERDFGKWRQQDSMRNKGDDRNGGRPPSSSKRPQSDDFSQSRPVRPNSTDGIWKNPLEVVYVTEIRDNMPIVQKKKEANGARSPVEVVYVTDKNKRDRSSDTSSSDMSPPFKPPQQDRGVYEKRDDVKPTQMDPEAPASFRPIPVADPVVMPESTPPEVPPKPFDDLKIFDNVDKHAFEVSKKEHRSFRDLVWHLIFKPDITDELEKARVIYLWLCSKDLTKLSFDQVQSGSPEEILMDLKRSKTTYAVVYEILCRYAGLYCKTISGYAKGAEYRPGMRFVGDPGQHSWNAVRVKGIWRLVDCHWSARRLVGKKHTPENVRYELDEYYFMPEPHQLIFTHFPEDSRWQLLDRPIKLVEFETLVSVKSAFFKYGLQVVDHREAVIQVHDEVTVRISCPPVKATAMSFTFTLTFDNGDEDFNGMKLCNYGMHEMIDGVAYFTLRLPKIDLYRFIIYAKDTDQEHTKEGIYGAVCEYAIQCVSIAAWAAPFPPCVHTSWGPGDSAVRYELVALQKGSVFLTENGLVEVRFRATRELRFTAKLKAVDIQNSTARLLNGCVVCRVVGDVTTFTVSVPEPGEFGLEIYANDPEVDGSSLYHAYQYLILCNEQLLPVRNSTGFSKHSILPLLPPGYLGPQALFKKLGLQCASHDDPYIHTDLPELQITFSMSSPVRFTSQLIQAVGANETECGEYVLQQCRGTKSVAFHIRLAKPTTYKFQVYAQPMSDTSDNLPAVYNCLIDFVASPAAAAGGRSPSVAVAQFPKQFGGWRDGCYLYEPLEGLINQPLVVTRITSQSFVYFKVDVPRANAVAVVVGDEWFQLETRGSPTSSLWEGDVNMIPYWGRESRLFVCANYGNVNSSYHTLLEYSI